MESGAPPSAGFYNVVGWLDVNKKRVAVGAYPTYHHDMFQTGYGTDACPPGGVPDPEFSGYHRQVFEFLKLRRRYEPK